MLIRIVLLEPGKNLRFSLEYCGKPSVSSMLKNALDMPSTSLREFLEYGIIFTKDRL